MKGFWKYFWTAYVLFFAIPFPMIIYYNTGYGNEGEGTSPWLALFYLLLSVILWGYLLQSWLRSWVFGPFRSRRDIKYLLREGVRKDATILKSRKTGTGRKGYSLQGLTVSFHNFSGTNITETLQIVDSKPGERRFEEGRTIGLRIDERLKTRPLLVFEDTKVSVNGAAVFGLFLAWLLILAAVLCYYGYSYILENNGAGWRFLKFYHPLLLCPLILIGTRFGLRRIGRILTGTPENSRELKYRGVRTTAKVTSAVQTGTYINNQPQVRFELGYLDDSGHSHAASLKKIVPLIDMGITKMSTVPIFYLKNKPGQVAFASDLGG